MHPLRRILAVLAALALALVLTTGLAACGGSSSSGGESVDELLAQTFGKNKPVRSGFLDLGLNLDLQGIQSLSGPVKVTLRGPFQSQGKRTLPKFDFTADLSASGQNFSAGAVSTGDRGFVKFQGRSYVLTDKLFSTFKQGYEESQKQNTGDKRGGVSFQSLGIDPRRWLKDAKKAGEQEIGGADTIHIEAAIDVPKFLDDVSTLLKRGSQLGVAGSAARGVPNGLTTKQREQIADAVKSADIDLFTGKDDKTLRRLVIDVGVDVPEAQRKDAGGLQSGKMSFSLTIARLNEDQEISAPKGARPLGELSSSIGQLFGAGSGAGSGSSGSGGAATTPGTQGANQEYLDCLQKAGSDVAKVQECAALLNSGG